MLFPCIIFTASVSVSVVFKIFCVLIVLNLKKNFVQISELVSDSVFE